MNLMNMVRFRCGVMGSVQRLGAVRVASNIGFDTNLTSSQSTITCKIISLRYCLRPKLSTMELLPATPRISTNKINVRNV